MIGRQYWPWSHNYVKTNVIKRGNRNNTGKRCWDSTRNYHLKNLLNRLIFQSKHELFSTLLLTPSDKHCIRLSLWEWFLIWSWHYSKPIKLKFWPVFSQSEMTIINPAWYLWNFCSHDDSIFAFPSEWKLLPFHHMLGRVSIRMFSITCQNQDFRDSLWGHSDT